MKLEIGKYYLREGYEGVELIYVFGTETSNEAADMTYPEEVSKDEVMNMLAIKVLPLISRKDYLNFQQSVHTETVFISTGETVYPCSWTEESPPPTIVSRFEKSYYFNAMVEKFLDHMRETYGGKYKDEQLCVRDIYL